MPGTLHKTTTDQATSTFIHRCAEIGLTAWHYDGQVLHRAQPANISMELSDTDHEKRLKEKLQKTAEQLRQANESIAIDPHHPAAWISDPADPSLAFILTPALESKTSPSHPEAFTATIKAMQWCLTDLRQTDRNQLAVEDMAEQLGQSYENITLLYRIGRSMRSIAAPEELAQSICHQVRITQGFGWSAVRFIHNHEDVSGLSNACFTTGDLPCTEKDFRQATDRLLTQPLGEHWNKLLQVGEHELADLMNSEVILEPILHDDRMTGIVLAGGKAGPGCDATSSDTQLLEAIAGFLSALHENAARFIEQKNMFISSLEAVSTALDAKDRYTHGHSERVAWLGTQLAEAIGLDANEVERIRISGLVHDVGKIGVPEIVLCKDGRLTDCEFEQIKKHPRIGYNILKGIPKIDDVLDGVLYHHERWDGQGYPTRLAGEAIPLYGRILAVADTFDAMSSTRSYRQAMPREQVLAEIAACAGTQFDPSLTEPFIRLDFTEYDAMVQRHQGNQASPSRDLAA